MSIPELVGKHVVLVPLRVEEADLLVKLVNDPANQPYWLGREGTRAAVLQHWPAEVFDDAYPQKGRAFRIDAGRSPVGAAVHGGVFGSPRNVLVELVLQDGTTAEVGSDAVQALTQYLFDALLVRKAWAEVHPQDARTLAAFQGAGYVEAGRTPEEGRVVLMRERPGTKRRGEPGPPAPRAASTKPK